MRWTACVTAVAVLLAAPAANAKEYCIYIQSRVTGDSKVHTCRDFKSMAECQEAADRIGGYCGAPPAK